MNPQFSTPGRFYTVVAVFLFSILLGRFAQLQIYQWEKYYRESEKNRVRDVVIPPQRGMIFDRRGEVLVDNRPSYSVSVVPYEFVHGDSSGRKLLSSILGEPVPVLREKIRRGQVGNFTPVKIKRAVGFKTLSFLEEYRMDLPGVSISIDAKRTYPAGVKAPHLFGYLGEITSDDLARLDRNEYRLGDQIGKNGLELQYERELRGRSGVQYVEVDVLGREVRTLHELPEVQPVPGQRLYLTIDANLQRLLEASLAGKKGAAVVLNARTGGVLAMVSEPDYDPEIFSAPLTPEIWNKLVSDPDKPLYNRACQSVYPPGSTFKLVLAAAGLETGRIDPDQTVFCAGSYRLGRRSFDCWKKGGHGEVDLLAAIEQSCNVYFYTRGLQVGLDAWAHFSRLFGFGQRTGIDLPNESPGQVPDKRYLDEKYGEGGWTRGLLLNLSVGQGDLLVTPLQMARFAMIIGNEGVAYKPHLVLKRENPATGEVVVTRLDSSRVPGISRQTFALLKRGMYGVVNGEKGTGKAARLRDIDVCGKTGTAQNPHGESHAWFIGFAPMVHPEIAFCILVENGGSGGAHAAPIAGRVLVEYFHRARVAKR
ncbi:MAG: penicillin-binding protein 2 [Calditrichaeota bacterium]|nr:MAG: penicillin-binding protein 2 [Calditrichota bacterium]